MNGIFLKLNFIFCIFLTSPAFSMEKILEENKHPWSDLLCDDNLEKCIKEYLKDRFAYLLSHDDLSEFLLDGRVVINADIYVENMRKRKNLESWLLFFKGIEERKKQYAEDEKFVNSFNKNHQIDVPEVVSDLTESDLPAEGAWIQQGFLGFSYKDHPSLGTSGAKPCFILAARNPLNSLTALFHMDVLNLAFVERLLSEVSNGFSEEIFIYLAGGEKETERGLQIEGRVTRMEEARKLIEKIIEHPSNKIVYSALGETELNSAALFIIPDTGKVYQGYSPRLLKFNNDEYFRLKFGGHIMPINAYK